MHVDFLRVQADKAIKVNVPLHFTNEDVCEGVKMGGGMVQHQATDMEIQCLPGDIPDFIEVDMAAVALGQIVHLSDVTLPAGVESDRTWHWAMITILPSLRLLPLEVVKLRMRMTLTTLKLRARSPQRKSESILCWRSSSLLDSVTPANPTKAPVTTRVPFS